MQTMQYPPQDGSDSDSDYSDSSHSGEADHDEERAARKVHLLLSEMNSLEQEQDAPQHLHQLTQALPQAKDLPRQPLHISD
jgi:hypothetical protein